MKDRGTNLLKIQASFTNYADRRDTRVMSVIVRMVMIMMFCRKATTLLRQTFKIQLYAQIELLFEK